MHHRALEEISHYLEDSGRSLTDFGLPVPILRSPEVSSELEAFTGREEELQSCTNDMVNRMDEDQITIFQTLYDIVILNEDDRHHMMTTFFIDGKPGRGKTFVADALATRLRSEGHIVLTVATSALAATLYERGCTARSLFCIPVYEVSDIFVEFPFQSK